jgi:hypothetical protein
MEPAQPDKSRNPYSPPAAVVADAAVTSRPMPTAVRRALTLYVVSFVLGLALMMIDRPAADAAYAEISGVAHAVSVGIVIVLGAWLFWKIRAGRNWARIVLLVLSAISVPASFLEILQLAPASPLMAGLKLIEQAMDISILFLLFFPGREYFRPPAPKNP